MPTNPTLFFHRMADQSFHSDDTNVVPEDPPVDSLAVPSSSNWIQRFREFCRPEVSRWFKCKSMEKIQDDASKNIMKRTLNSFDLTM